MSMGVGYAAEAAGVRSRLILLKNSDTIRSGAILESGWRLS